MVKMKLREWHGLRCRAKGRVVTKGGLVAEKGAVGIIKTDSGTRATFEVDACKECNLTFYVRGLNLCDLPTLFEIIERVEPALGPKKPKW